MPGVETLRDFVNQRLTAAAEEIFGVFERTIAEYEEQLCRCKEENERQQKLLDDVQLHFHRADNQQLSVTPEEVSSEPLSSSLDQEDTEPPHIKQEEEELWSSQEGLDEVCTIKFPFAPVSVKTEDDEEKPQSSQLHEIQSEGGKTGADEEDRGGPEQTRRLLHPETQDKTDETDVSNDWRVKNDYRLKCVKNFGDDRSDNEKKSHGCSQCGKRFQFKSQLNTHVRIHTGEKPFSCSQCEKGFSYKSHLNTHMVVHTGEKPFTCPRCDKKFTLRSNLAKHVMTHTGKKPFSCPECGKKFYQNVHLSMHRVIHTGVKLFSCSECDKKFSQKSHLTSHMVTHTGEKPFSCKFCNKKFSWVTQRRRHKCTGGQVP